MFLFMRWLACGAGGRCAALVTASMLAVACARSAGPEGTAAGGVPGMEARGDTPLIALRRGGRWSVLSVRPPHLGGPQFQLVLRNGVLTGTVTSGTAPTGTLRVTIREDGASGFGPLGPIALEYFDDSAGLRAEGLWNGGRVRLLFTTNAVTGVVTANSEFYGKMNPSSGAGLDSFRPPSRMPNTLSSEVTELLPADTTCEYDLSELGKDGALDGGSTCAGMMQQTRLEVPRVAQTWMTRAELVTVLVAMLAAPPAARGEDLPPIRRRR